MPKCGVAIEKDQLALKDVWIVQVILRISGFRDEMDPMLRPRSAPV